MDRGFHTITLGCKLNQFDSAAIEGELVRRGFRPEPDAGLAAIVIVNTCTVTHRADAEARKLIRRVRRSNPDCQLLVTGCYAELDADAIRAIPGVDRVFGNREKPVLGEILDELGVHAGPAAQSPAPGVRLDRGCDAAVRLPDAVHFGERARAFLKIQDGCRLRCSYCIIPTVRGDSRSVGPAEVIAAARSLFGAGYPEVVLTGVNTGDYGRDLDPPTSLAALLRGLVAVCGANRVRLNSLEPLTVTDEIIALMRDEPRLAPHLQVPLQSGSAAVLRGMRRNYRREVWLERLSRLREAIPHIGLGADVIVGFPGESDARFEESYEFIGASPLNYLHVFSWSPRPGTPAAVLPEHVPSRVIRERTHRLRALGDELALRFRRRFVGQALEAVVLDAPHGGTPQRALTGNFIEVALEGSARPAGSRVDVRIRSVDHDRVAAQIA